MPTDRVPRPLRVTVSGSFRRAIDEVRHAVATLLAHQVDVLSPRDPRPVEQFHDFVYVASDIDRTVRVLQERHFAAIERSDLLWVCLGDGSLGASTAAEIHHANLVGVPVFSVTLPDSLYWRQMVIPVPNVSRALHIVRSETRRPGRGVEVPNFLLDPNEAAEVVHSTAESIRQKLLALHGPEVDDPELWRLLDDLRSVTSSRRS